MVTTKKIIMNGSVNKNIKQYVSPLNRIGYTAPIKSVKMQQTKPMFPEIQLHLQHRREPFNSGITPAKVVKPITRWLHITSTVVDAASIIQEGQHSSIIQD